MKTAQRTTTARPGLSVPRGRRSRLSFTRAAMLAAYTVVTLLVPATVNAANDVPPFTAAAAESELVRLLNVERVRVGLPALTIDPWLAEMSRDGDIPCPEAPNLVMHGRADDMAAHWGPDTFGDPNDPHSLRLCPEYSALDVMSGAWGYGGVSGEIFAWNGGTSSDMSVSPYPVPCGFTFPACYDHGPSMVAKAVSAWMESPGHRAIAVDPRYTRFGCGAAELAAGSDYDGAHYFVCVFTASAGTAAPIPTPADVRDSTFKKDIVWIYQNGITTGCSATLYCPLAPVTRGQMASFVARAMELPTTTKDYFDDDDGTTHEANINRVAEARITSGCALERYCPDVNVTRGQMASFLVRALGTTTGAGTDYFTDDNGTTHEGDIDRLRHAGLTSGCTSTTYCPNADVTRGQMAAFLHRAFGP